MTNENLEILKKCSLCSWVSVSVQQRFPVKLESYYQHLYNIPVKASFPEYSLINSGDQFGGALEDSLINDGRGKNYGIEITVEKFLRWGLVLSVYIISVQFIIYWL